MTYRPLAGIKVLELAQLLPGPMLTRALADRGADVVKVEPPSGDPLRQFPPDLNGYSVHFEAVNRGKRSVVADLRDPEGRAIVAALVEVADVVVDGYRVGALEKLGFRWDELRQRRPEVVVTSISGFGQSGPLADLPAHGLNIDAQSASIAVTGGDDDLRYASPVSWGVEVGYLNGALSTAVAALHSRTTGEGVWLDVSCWDASVEAHRMSLYPALAGLPLHGITERHGPMHSIYRTGDGGFVALMATEERLARSFFLGVGRPDLADRYQLRQYADATEYPGDEEIRRFLTELFLTDTKTAWNQRFLEWGVAGGGLLTEDEVLAHPHFAHRGLATIDAASGMPSIGDPVRYQEHNSRPGLDAGGAPALGAHGDAVLTDWLRGSSSPRTKETKP
jgi:crotonobetainyl-CoA:carnitine CoA-transferase CaiB-like acyl-CoA transferase